MSYWRVKYIAVAKGFRQTSVAQLDFSVVRCCYNSSKKYKGQSLNWNWSKYEGNILSKCQIQTSKENVDRYTKFSMLLEEDLISIKLILE